jgi:hypothetical protein
MVGIAQLVEHLVVVQGAAGSSPVTHPKKKKKTREVIAGFLLSRPPVTLVFDAESGAKQKRPAKRFI